MGWTWQPDAEAAIDYLSGRSDVRDGRIGGLGLSTGAEVLLEAAAHDDRLQAVVADGAIARSMAETELLSGPEKIRAVPTFALLVVTMRVLGAGSPPPSLKELVPHIAPRPALLVANGDRPGARAITGLRSGGRRDYEPLGTSDCRAHTRTP